MALLYYGTITEANTYFDERLHSTIWSDSTSSDREKSLNQSRITIDNLNYKGVKAAVYDVMYDSDGDLNSPQVTETVIIAAGVTQPLQFPRGTDESVPEQIKQSQWEVAILLLDGVDPDSEYQTLRVMRQGYSSVSTTYNPSDVNSEHITYGIVSPTAWRLLYPFLLFDGSIVNSRAN
jgi:hypothetical protein